LVIDNYNREVMLKVIVFLYQYYLAIDKSENSAYVRVLVWFFVVFGLLQICLFNLFNLEIPYIDENIRTGNKVEKEISFFLVSIPFFALFYILYPPNKLKVYSGKFIYLKNYIWYLRIAL